MNRFYSLEDIANELHISKAYAAKAITDITNSDNMLVHLFRHNNNYRINEYGRLLIISQISGIEKTPYRFKALAMGKLSKQKEHLYEHLVMLRSVMGVTAKELCKLADINTNSYQIYERGARYHNRIYKFKDEDKEKLMKVFKNWIFKVNSERENELKHNFEQNEGNDSEKKYSKKDVIEIVNKILAEKGVTND